MRYRQAFRPFYRRITLNPRTWWEWAGHYCGEVRSFFERGWYGYATPDVWEWASYQAQTNVGALSYLRNKGAGAPITLCDWVEGGADSPSMPRCGTEEGRGCRCCHERWAAALEGMLDGFQAAMEEDEGGVEGWGEREEARRERIQRGLAVYVKHFTALWD